jgi:hypothetical protein
MTLIASWWNGASEEDLSSVKLHGQKSRSIVVLAFESPHPLLGAPVVSPSLE